MFQAIVLVCAIFDPTNCIQLEDQRGPYKILKNCENRCFEISQNVHTYMPGFKPVKWRCAKLKKGKLSI